MVTAEEQATAIQQAQQQLQQQREASQKTQQELLQQQQKLPAFNQQNLRQGVFQGVQGMVRRGQVQQFQNRIGENLSSLDEYNKNLDVYGNQISQAQQELDAYNQALSSYNEQKNAFEIAKRLFNQEYNSVTGEYTGKAIYETNPLVKNYLREFESEGEAYALAKLNASEPQLPTFTINPNVSTIPTLTNAGGGINVRGTGQTDAGILQSFMNSFNKIVPFTSYFGSASALPSVNASSNVTPTTSTGIITKDIPATNYFSNPEYSLIIPNQFGGFSPSSIPMSVPNPSYSVQSPLSLVNPISNKQTNLIGQMGEAISHGYNTLSNLNLFGMPVLNLGSNSLGNQLTNALSSPQVQNFIYDTSGINRANAIISVNRDFANKGMSIDPNSDLFNQAVQNKLNLINLGQQFGNPLLGGFASLGLPATLPNFLKTTYDLREPQTSFVEYQQPVDYFGKPTTISNYKITQELTPPRLNYGLMDTGSGYLGKGDNLFVSYQPPKLQLTNSVFPIIGKSPVLTLTSKGNLAGDINIISGGGVPLTDFASQFSQLPKTEQYIWKQYAESLTGRAVKLEDVPQFFNKNAQQYSGYLQNYNLGNIATIGKETTMTLFPKELQGQTTTRYLSGSQFQKTGENALADIYQGNVFFKDVTYPFARATGETPSMSGTIFKIKEPLIIGEDNSGSGVFFSGGTKTPLSQTFSEEVLVTPKPVPKPMPKNVPKSLITKGGIENNAYISGTIGLASGLYSRGYNGQLTGDIPSYFSSGFNQGINQLSTPQTTSAQTYFGTTTNTGEKTSSSLGQFNWLGQNQKETPKFLNPQLEINSPVQNFRQSPFEIQVPREAQISKQVQGQISGQREVQRQTQRQISFNPDYPQKNPPRVPDIFLLKGKNKKENFIRKKGKSPFFRTYARRYGKYFEIGKNVNPVNAFSLGERFTRSNLSASFFVTENGKRVQPRSVPVGFGYSKREPLVLFQKSGSRLSSQPERREIQLFKRLKSKKVKFF